jgi:hypothetical protein
MHGSFGKKPLVRAIGLGSRFSYKHPHYCTARVIRAITKESTRWRMLDERTFLTNQMETSLLWDASICTPVEPAIVLLGDRFRLGGTGKPVVVVRKLDAYEWEVLTEGSGTSACVSTAELLDLRSWEPLPLLTVRKDTPDPIVELVDYAELEYQQLRSSYGQPVLDQHQSAIMASLKAPLPVRGR